MDSSLGILSKTLFGSLMVEKQTICNYLLSKDHQKPYVGWPDAISSLTVSIIYLVQCHAVLPSEYAAQILICADKLSPITSYYIPLHSIESMIYWFWLVVWNHGIL